HLGRAGPGPGGRQEPRPGPVRGALDLPHLTAVSLRSACMSDRVPPSVAVVICTRGDRPELLREAVASVVEQDYPGPVEVMVVFDRAEPDESLADPAAGRERPAEPVRRVRVMRNNR